MSTERRLLRRAQSPRRRRLSGAVYAEAVMVMGTMILLLFLIEFVHDGFARAAVAGTETRGHGWEHAMEPCENNPPAPTQIRDEGAFSVGGIGSLFLITTQALQLIQYQPLLIMEYDLFSFRFPQNRFSQVADLERTSAIGGTARYGHQIVLTCNEDLDEMEFPGWQMGLWTFVAFQTAGL
jgi:hypothetical protein